MKEGHLSEEQLYHYRLDEKEGVTDHHIKKHLDECPDCQFIYKKIASMNSDLQQLKGIHSHNDPQEYDELESTILKGHEDSDHLPDNTSEIQKPQNFAPYTFYEKLGQGGMGTIWKAYDSHNKRYAAVKVIKAELSDNNQLQKRLLREALILSKLDHPNIVKVYDVIKQDGHTMIIMEYIEGYNLSDFIKHKDHNFLKILSIFTQTLSGIQAAHEKDILHRDIKTLNVMIDCSGNIKVLDFGLAKTLNSDTFMTTTKHIMGTLYYMAPEILQGAKASVKSDIYSLGILLFEIVKPTYNINDSSFHDFIIKNRDPEMKKNLEQIPDNLKDMLFKMCAADPHERYHSVAEIANDLKELPLRAPFDREESQSPQVKKSFSKVEIAWGATLLIFFLVLFFYSFFKE